MSLFDFVYVDRQKVSSLYSQLTGGVVEALETSNERSRDIDNKRTYDFRIFQHAAGGVEHDRSSDKVTIKPHHALILELEQELMQQGFLLDLTATAGSVSLRDNAFRKKLKNTLCLKIAGRAVIEDFERMKHIASVFPAVAAFVNKSAESNARNSAAYLLVKDQLDQLQQASKQLKDRNARASSEKQLRDVRSQLDAIAKGAGVHEIDQWVLDGFRTWVDAFLPGISNLRMYPEGCPPDEHAFGHLKRDGIEQDDNNLLHFTYGSMPTERLTLLGVVTSVPNEGGDAFSPLAEFDRENLKDFESVERAFRGLFRGFDGLEALIRTCRFPRVMVEPLTLYREVRSSKSAM